MALVATEQPQNVVSRVVQLPLVSSTYDMVSNVYINTKENHPYIKSVCEVAERSVKTITSVALTSAMPIIQKLEPQIAVANDLACKGLDKIEQKLPILHQPSDKVVASAKDVVTGAKDTVSTTIGGVVDKTKGAVHESVEMTKAVVNGSVNTVMESRVVKMVTSGVDTALTKSESLVDMYLPLTEEELAKEAMKVEGFDVANIRPSYYVRLGSLSTKLRKRAYNQALSKVKDAKQRSQEAITQLHYTVDLIEYARKNVDSANQKLHGAQEKLHQSWVEWKKRTGYSEDNQKAEHIESRTLAIARSLTTQLQTTCLTLVSSIQGLPQNIQDQAHSLTKSAADVYQSFNSASSFRDMSDAVLARSRGQLGKMKESMDGMMDYLVNNTALNWLVPDFTITDLSSEPDEYPYMLAMEDGVANNDYSRSNGPILATYTGE
ncbi:perilipin-2 isoform X1 [Polypterus senegalus]|uniref:perilipin-2 isoform X1 n=1 Tax=Polypterus senegalus TaxID=55291 RepID=UPI0019644DF1|nr:perilipin-2 isoform X1 [Polypterus senegalus]